MTIGHAILLLLLGSIASIALFVLMIRFEESNEKEKNKETK